MLLYTFLKHHFIVYREKNILCVAVVMEHGCLWEARTHTKHAHAQTRKPDIRQVNLKDNSYKKKINQSVGEV